MILGTLSIVLLVVASGLTIGQLRGGDLAGLWAAGIKALPLTVAALALQLLLGLPGRWLDGTLRLIGSILLVVSLVLALVALWANRRLPGMPLVLLGLLANLLVVGLNGAMPVSTATLEQSGISATGAELGDLGREYVLAGPETRLAVLRARFAIPPTRTVVGVGDLTQCAGLVVLVQGLMVRGSRRRRLRLFQIGEPVRWRSGRPASTNPSASALDHPQPNAAATLTVPADFIAKLLRAAWLAILLGLLVQLALLLAAAEVGGAARLRPLTADTVRTLGWSVLVCTGIALGRGASQAGAPQMGVAGLLAAPLALTTANMLQKGVAEALAVAPDSRGATPLWVLAIKAAEYGCLGAAFGWLGRRSWAGALAHATAGLITGMVFGSARLALAAQSASAPPRPAQLVVQGVNELLFPIGCALVVYAAATLAKRISTGPTAQSQQPQSVRFATTGNQMQAS
jgi:hypothetical protein